MKGYEAMSIGIQLVIFVAIIAAFVIGVIWLDAWHKRYAPRAADAQARRLLRRFDQ